jgi:hypothetical protein
MNGQTKHWVILVIGLLGILGAEIVKITAWNELLTPSFIGALLIQIAALGATITGAYNILPKPPGNTVTLKGRS